MDVSESIQFLALTVIVLSMTLVGYAIRRPILVLASSMAWVVLGVFCWRQSTETWDMYQGLFWFCIAMTILTSIEGVIMRGQTGEYLDEGEEAKEDGASDEDELRARIRQRAIAAQKRRAYRRLINRLREGK